MSRIALTALLMVAIAFAKKKNPDDQTQTLALPPEPPMVATGQTSRLLFNVSPLSNKGLLSQQTHDALKAILKANGNVPVIHVRALVAGSGDLRRVPQIVGEVFSEKHLPLPSVSVVQVGGLAMVGAQVVIEAVSEGRKEVNPDGLTFGAGSTSEEALHGATPLMVTCFVSSMQPMAGVDVVQMQLAPNRSATVCEAVGRGGTVKAQKLAFTGTQVAIGTEEKALQRLRKDLGDAQVIATNVYAMDRASLKGAVVIPVEGVASSDASLAVDEIAVAH
jgi:hypothetical protein